MRSIQRPDPSSGARGDIVCCFRRWHPPSRTSASRQGFASLSFLPVWAARALNTFPARRADGYRDRLARRRSRRHSRRWTPATSISPRSAPNPRCGPWPRASRSKSSTA